MADEAPGPKWRVIDQTPTTRVSSSGRFEDVMEVTFETALGDVGKVSVPMTAYSAEAVRAMIEPLAEEMLQTRLLQG